VNYLFLLIDGNKEMQWPMVLQRALSPLGKLHVVSEDDAVQAVTQNRYAIVIIDMGAIDDAVLLVSRLQAQRPGLRIVIATASPTWTRARQMFQAGAADYIPKSLDEKDLFSKIQAVLKVPSPQLH
jgi:DNA-binding NtrC family response regulator